MKIKKSGDCILFPDSKEILFEKIIPITNDTICFWKILIPINNWTAEIKVCTENNNIDSIYYIFNPIIKSMKFDISLFCGKKYVCEAE